MAKQGRLKPNKTGWVIYADWMEALLDMPEEIRHKIADALMRYCLYGEEPQDPVIKYSMFFLMKQIIDRDSAAYEEKKQRISELRSEAGKLAGAKEGNQNARKYENSRENNRNKRKRVKTSKNEQNEQNEQNEPVSVSVSVESIESDNNIRARENNAFEKFQEEVFEFADDQGINKDECNRFVEYTSNNFAIYADEKGIENLYDKNGEIINNWKGALIEFARTRYNRAEWEKEHGIG